jgi:quercetin dioxygenase-like cupin family protein
MYRRNAVMKVIDRDVIARAWANRGFSCDLWVDPPGQRWEDFTHATDEVVLVLEGQMEFELEGHVHHPPTGQELLIPAGARHSARNIGTTSARWLYGYQKG